MLQDPLAEVAAPDDVESPGPGLTLVKDLTADEAVPAQGPPMPAGLGPKMRAEMVASRLRGAALAPRLMPDQVTGEPALAPVFEHTAVVDRWTTPVTVGRVDTDGRLVVTTVVTALGWGAAVLDTAMSGPWVTLRRGVGDRRRERCGLESRDRAGGREWRLRLSTPVLDRIGVVAGDIVVMFADDVGDQLHVSTPLVLAAAAPAPAVAR